MTFSQNLGRWHGRGWFADTGGAMQMFPFESEPLGTNILHYLQY